MKFFTQVAQVAGGIVGSALGGATGLGVVVGGSDLFSTQRKAAALFKSQQTNNSFDAYGVLADQMRRHNGN